MKIKNIKMISMILCMMMLVVTVGCSSPADETPREALEKAFEKELDVVSSETELDLNLSFSVDDATSIDPDAAMMLGAMEDVRLNMRIQSDLDAAQMAMKARAYAAGMNVDFELIMTEEIIIAQIPMLGMALQEPMLRDGYVFLRLDELMDDMNFLAGEGFSEMEDELDEAMSFFPDHEEMEEVTRVALDLLLGAFDDDSMENLGQQAISIDGEEVSLTHIAINIGEKEIIALANAMVDLYETEEMRDFMYGMFGELEAMSREEFEEEMDFVTQEMREDIDMFMEEAMPLMDHEASETTLSFYLDSDYQILRTEVDSMIVMEPEEDVNLSMNIQFKVDAISINEPLDIEIPELTEENSIDLMQLFFQMMFAF